MCTAATWAARGGLLTLVFPCQHTYSGLWDADAAVALQAAARGHATRRRQLLRRDDAGADAAGTGEAGTGEADADAEAADVELMAKGKARHEAAVAMQAVQRGRATRRSALRPATPVPTN
jgi:hypothetical protein